jgi:hypothetical protein
MSEAALRPDGVTNGVDETPGWSYYTSAIDAILDTSSDECDLLAERAERSVLELQKQREKLLQILERLSVLVNRYGLKRTTVAPDDAVGLLAYEIDNIANDILSVFKNPAPSLEQLHKVLPSSKRVRSTETKLEAADGLLNHIQSNVGAIFIDFPTRVHQMAQELRWLNRLDSANHVLQCQRRLEAVHQELLSSQDPPLEMSLSHVLTLAAGDAFDALKASVTCAEKEWEQIKKEEDRLRRQREIEEENRRAEEARLEAERKRQEEELAAERKYLAGLLHPKFYIAPLAALAALVALLVYLSGWAAFGASMTTLVVSIASGLLGILIVTATEKKKGDLPKFFSNNEKLLAFSLVFPLTFAALQFVGAIVMAIVVFFFAPRLPPLIDAVLPLGSWPRFFGFILMGPLACLAACTAAMAAYYLALIKPMRLRIQLGEQSISSFRSAERSVL